MKLSKKERLFLYNQYEILKALNQDDIDYYENTQKILADGYEYEYDDLVSAFSEVRAEVSKEVHNILYMFRVLYHSYNNLPDKTGLNQEDYMFEGFDGNEETDYCEYARWLIEDRNEYTESSSCDINSHCNRVQHYRNMLERFNNILDRTNSKYYNCKLSLKDMNYIIGK